VGGTYLFYQVTLSWIFCSPIDSLLALEQTVVHQVSAQGGMILMVTPEDLVDLTLRILHTWFEVLGQVAQDDHQLFVLVRDGFQGTIAGDVGA
jgi:hypothetical protein